MSYTWGYVKDAALSKLDLDAAAAIDLGLMNKFPYFANEAVTQISSSIKPKNTFAIFNVENKQTLLDRLCRKYYNRQVDTSFLEQDELSLNQTQLEFKMEYDTYVFVNDVINMPDDFISFSPDVFYVTRCNERLMPATNADYVLQGYAAITFKKYGVYRIPYNARWFTFLPTTDDNVVLPMPADIVDTLPTYIASQCLKIDDEQKAIIYRNEFELMLARIDDSYCYENGTISILGGW